MVAFNSENLKKIFLNLMMSFLFLFVIFCPKIQFLPYYSWVLAFLGFICLFDFKFAKSIHFFSKNNLTFVVLLGVSIFFNAIMIPFVSGKMDFSYSPIIISMILVLFRNILLLYFIYKIYKSNEDGLFLDKFCKYFLNACCIYVLFTVLFAIFPSFKDFWLFHVLKNVEIRTDYKFRYSVDGFAAFSSSSLFSYAIILMAFVISKENKLNVVNIIKYFIILLGCLLYGRVSIVGIFFSLILIIFKGDTFKENFKMFLIMLAAFTAMVLFINFLATFSKSLYSWKEWAFAIVKQVFVNKKITDGSFLHLFKDMFFIPEPQTLLMGDGFYTDPATGLFYMHTDVGYLRLICYSGIVGLLIAYCPFICLIYFIFKSSSSKKEKRFIICTFLMCLILELKGETYHRIMMLVYPLLLLVMHSEDPFEHRINNFLENAGKKGLIFRLLFGVFSIFPIDRKKIVVDNFNGKGYDGNPKYVCEKLLSLDSSFKVYWLVNDDKESTLPGNIISLKRESLSSIFHLVTAKIWLDTCRKPLYVTKRKEQVYFQLWHGDLAFKATEAEVEDFLSTEYVAQAKHDSEMIDYFVTGSQCMTDTVKKSYWYNGEILRMGAARNDVFFKDSKNIKNKVMSQFHCENKKIILYAPTFRNDDRVDCFKWDYEKVLRAFEKKFNQKCALLIRMHPNVEKCFDCSLYENVIDATSYPDMQELLLTCDVLITDFSSSMFDLMLMNKPVFIFAKDFKEYIENERKLCFDIHQLPFMFAENEDQLIFNIQSFDSQKNIENIASFKDKNGVIDDGNASLRLCNKIIEVCK